MPSLIDGSKAGVYRRSFVRDATLQLYLPLWHPKNQGSPIISSDLNAHSCTVVGAVWGLQGRTFDGGDDTIAVVNLHQHRITLMAWVKSGDATQANNGIVTQSTADGQDPWHEYGLVIETAATPRMFITTGGVRTGAVGSNNLTSWTHLAGVYDGATIVLYINGIAGTPVAKTGDINDYGQALRVGSYRTSTFFKGTIGEVLLYNRALSLAEVQQNYQATRWRYL